MESTQESTEKLVRQVLEHEEVLPPRLRSAILGWGEQAVEPLLALLEDEALAHEGAPGGGYGPIHAAELLVALRVPAAIEPLVERLARTQPGAVLHDTLLSGLEELGPVVAPAALEVLARVRGADERLGLLAVLARCGARDERILSLLLEQLQELPGLGAGNLAHHGDPRAIEPLKRALEALEVDPSDLAVLQDILELAAAIVELGGTLEADQAEKVVLTRQHQRELNKMLQHLLGPVVPSRPRERLGRSDPCGCGGG